MEKEIKDINIDTKCLAFIFKLKRQELQISQREASKYAGLTRSAISLFETGKSNISIIPFLKLCYLYGMTDLTNVIKEIT